MKTTDAKSLALTLIKAHGLSGWKFEFDRAVTRLGQCRYSDKTISLSAPLVRLNDEATIRNTILHEIAHALVGLGHGHDAVWRRKALEIGCNAQRCSSTASVPEGKYQATCVGCNKTYHRFKSPKRNSSCGQCSPNRYNEQYKLNFEKS